MSDDETEEEFWWYALKVGFERLDDGSMPTLDFITAVNPPDDTKYWLSSFLNSDDAPVVTYNEKEYRVTRLDGSRLRQGTNGPYLNIKIQTSDRQSKSRRRVTGVKVNG
jgi:hypothetical protein